MKPAIARLRRVHAATWIAILALLSTGVSAQPGDPDTAPAPDPIRAEALAQRQDEAQREVAELRERAGSLVPGSPERVRIEEQLEVLRQVGSTLERAIEERRTLDTASEPAPLADAPASTSIASLIEIYEEIEKDDARLEDLARAVDATREAEDAAQAALRDAERTRREAREAFDASPSPETEGRLELARLRSRAAQELVNLRDLELRGDRAGRSALEERVEALTARAEALAEALREGPGAESMDADLVRREGELARREEEAKRALDTAELRLQGASSRYASQAAPSPHELEEIEALQLARDAAAQAVATLAKQRERLETERETRTRWLTLLRDEPPSSTLDEWREATGAQAEAYRRTLLQRQGRLADLQAQSDELDRRVDQAADPRLREALEQRRAATERLIRLLVADVSDLARHERIQRRLLRGLEDASGTIALRERLASAWRAVSDLWAYEITTVDDEPITVGNAVLALLLFALGFSVSRRLSQALRNVLDARFRLEPGVAGAAQTAVFYLLLVSFGLFALRTVNFPLTAFTVAGGALAIGIGFGSQNVMNNFISGLILMLERPVRSNDLVEVENTHGVIEQIGARSTRIRATDGRHLIVPNSFFLENNVVNWTLSDDLIRSKVSVGVIYGSPTRLVEKLIRQALDENPKVLGHPEPIIVFSEFGDNSLNFDAYFWTRARGPMAVNQLGGEVRFRIDDLFREHELVIAFPQRDVHLDSASPIEVRMIGDGADTKTTLEREDS